MKAADTTPAAPTLPLLLTQQQAWVHLGVSRAGWFKLKAADKLPKAVSVPGVGVRYRRADLEHYVAKLRFAHRRPERELCET